jgi:hypothetical protein
MVFWVFDAVLSCRVTDVSEEYIASIFRAEDGGHHVLFHEKLQSQTINTPKYLFVEH